MYLCSRRLQGTLHDVLRLTFSQERNHNYDYVEISERERKLTKEEERERKSCVVRVFKTRKKVLILSFLTSQKET